MIPNSETINVTKKLPRPVNWLGRSGRSYALVPEQIEDFVLEGRDLYVIAEGEKLRWIGTAGDLIQDQVSRARFREAVKVASSVLRLSNAGNDVERMTAVWDIEGGHLVDTPAMVH